jgi:2Fe-2S ferredoxin
VQLRPISIKFQLPDGESKVVDAAEGMNLLEVAHENDIDIEGACGGECACSTCHVIFEQSTFDGLPEMDEEEEDMLDLALGLTDTSRLGCQVLVTKELEGITVSLPDEVANLMD